MTADAMALVERIDAIAAALGRNLVDPCKATRPVSRFRGEVICCDVGLRHRPHRVAHLLMPRAVGIDGELRSTSGIPLLLTTSEGVSANLKWLVTLRSRVGVAFDRFLVYGTGGVAFGGVDAAGDITLTLSNPGALALPNPATLSLAASERRTHVGWTAGGGVEGIITSNLSAKVEYLYADLGWLKHEGPITIGGTLAPLVPAGISLKGGGDFKVTVHTIKLGINYRFGGPVIARD